MKKSFFHHLHSFATLLREWHIPVGSDEVLNAVESVEKFGIEPQVFKNVLKTLWLKKAEDEGTFDLLFDIYFYGAGTQPLTGDVKGGESLSPVLNLILSGDDEAFIRAIETALNSYSRQENQVPFGALMWRIITTSGMASASSELRAHLRGLVERGEISEEEFERLLQEGEEKLRKLRERLRTLVEKMLAERGASRERRLENLMEREFFALSDDEIQDLRKIARELGRKLKTAFWVARRKSRKGALDLRKTLRESESTDGVPFKLSFKKKRPRKQKLVILADVSSSMRHSLDFFLSLLRNIKEEFAGVRLFIFVSECMEISKIPWDQNVEAVLQEIAEKENFNLYAYTNYGSSLRSFLRQYGSALTYRTSVIIIGDGRSNYSDPGEEPLAKMREVARRIYWLNPEPLYGWITGDSEMRTFIKYVDGAYVVRSLKDMWDFVRDLVEIPGRRRKIAFRLPQGGDALLKSIKL